MDDRETLKAGLYLVATPIGNLRDITLRALDVLRTADIILCEDTRVSGKLLKAYDIRGDLRVYNDHSDETVREGIVAEIAGGAAVTLISDAGTPLICDPGYKLVALCRAHGFYVTALPGANAPLSALQLSGMGSDAFSFIGFLPSKMKARREALARWSDVPGVLIAFESAKRLLKALEDIDVTLGAREVCVVREITKMYEEARSGVVGDLIMHYRENGSPKGEIVLVIAPAGEKRYDSDEIEKMIRCALKHMRSKEAAAFIAEKTGVKKSELYDIAVRVGGER